MMQWMVSCRKTAKKVCMRLYTQTYLCTYIHMVCSYYYTYICTYVHRCTHTYCMYIHTYIRMYVHIMCSALNHFCMYVHIYIRTSFQDASFRYGRPDLGLPSTGKPHRKQRANDSQQLLMTPVSQVRNPLTEMNTTLSPSTNAAYSPFISDVCQKRVGVEPPHSSISTAKMTAYDPIRLCSRDLWADVDENHCPSASTVSSKVTHHSESSEREVPPDPLPTTNSSCLKNTHVFQCLTPLIDASLHFCPTDCSNSEGN